MASGDIVNGFLPASTWTTFVPAVGVEVVITAVLGNISDCEVGLYDGVTSNHINVNGRSNGVFTSSYKIGLTNSKYLRAKSAGDNGFFTGMQTK